jgi:hypothetical protein
MNITNNEMSITIRKMLITTAEMPGKSWNDFKNHSTPLTNHKMPTTDHEMIVIGHKMNPL